MLRMSLPREKSVEVLGVLIALIGSGAGVLAYLNDVHVWPANGPGEPAVTAPPPLQTPAPAPPAPQTTYGPNSPNISGVNGPVNLNYGKP
ncbi:hypothetical protein [Siccirubricoccus deserti]|uniref:Uncharacterized protein n=1 Tax=Siccirubricoccus deserti TaxID=2013562 RepID=A0A9X0UCC4_9PROT|nr:hypothetical protein [Siccirubricoccus deserti]MBC4014276.1 hypothetical protein [Siccirubricoccus deserti]